MSVSAERNGGTVRIRIGGAMTIYDAAGIKKNLEAHLFSADEAEMDLSEVSEIDTAGLQLLILAKKESLNARRRLMFIASSAAVDGLAALYGVKEFIGL